MIQGYPDTAPAQKRVLFLDREVRQRLIAADVQRTHGDRVRGKGFQLLAVVFALFLF